MQIAVAGLLGVGAPAINQPGWLAGASPQGTAFVLAPEGSISAPVYFRDTTPADGNNDLIHALPGLPAYQSSGVWDINDTGWVAGLSVVDDGINWYESPTICVGNTPIDLSYITTSAWGILDTWATGINNLGLVVIGPDLYWRDCDISSYVVVPKDNDGDSVPDTWFEDKNGDGLNDLLKLIASPSGYNAQEGFWTHVFEPRGINDTGQIILNPWTGSPCRLTPDYADADGDGNPWYADASGDGFNDLMVELIGLGGAGSYATSINAAGQVVGNSNGRAVLWNFTRRNANSHRPGPSFQVRAQHGSRRDQRRGPDRGR